MGLRCPYCREDIEREISTSGEWDEDGFDTRCPECGKKITITVQVEEYSYRAEKDDVDDGDDDE